MLKIKDGYKLELQTPETMQLFGNIKKKKILDKTKNWENVSTPEVVKVVLIKCTSADNQYKQKSEVLYIFTPNKPYGYLLILFRMGIFGTAHGWGGGGKKPPSLKPVTHILQWWNLAHLCFT